MVFTDVPHGETFSDLKRRVEMLESLVMTLRDQVRMLLPPPAAPTSPGFFVREEPAALQVVPPDPAWIPILHRMERTDPRFPRPCGQVGLYLTEPPTQHRNATLEVMRILVPGEDRWRQPTQLDLPVCSSCGAYVDPFSNADLDYLSQMLPSVPSAPSPKRRVQRKPEVESTPNESPGSNVSRLPPAFPAHTPRARDDDEETLTALRELADGLGLPG